MKIEKAKIEDLEQIIEIYNTARNFMWENGNPSQWSVNYPSRALIIQDIENSSLYVGVEDENHIIHYVFTFFIGVEKCYEKIENGNWLNDKTYGVMHRIASDGKIKGVFKTCFNFCKAQIANIRIDTHNDNKIMQCMIERNGFKKCGTIYVEDGTERIAYQWIK